MSTNGEKPGSGSDQLNKYHWYTPRFWDGMCLGTWCRLLARHRFAVSPSRFTIPLGSMFLAPANTVCHYWQELRWRRRVERTPLAHPPLFILGHWRSGTTMLHELLIRDTQHTYPTTFDCFSPNDFLSTGKFVSGWFGFLMPGRRPMDNMAAGWERPQEDEFALMNMGVPSIYETLAFPNHGPQNLDYVDFEGVPPQDVQRWQQALLLFIKRLNFRDPRRIVLKSPPHTARIKTLLELFPDAQFIHIVRDPYSVYQSSLRLWRALIETQGMQVPKYEWLEEFVLSLFDRVDKAFERHRPLLNESNFCEVRYEQLVAEPIEQVEAIYHKLQLGNFENVRPDLEKHLSDVGTYSANRHAIDQDIRATIDHRWGDYIRRYGYLENSQCAEASVADASQ